MTGFDWGLGLCGLLLSILFIVFVYVAFVLAIVRLFARFRYLLESNCI